MLVRGVPICVRTDRIRPCTSEEALAYQYLSADGNGPRYEARPPREQQAFLDERALDDIAEDAFEPRR